jgi:hypothetical protein
MHTYRLSGGGGADKAICPGRTKPGQKSGHAKPLILNKRTKPGQRRRENLSGADKPDTPLRVSGFVRTNFRQLGER